MKTLYLDIETTPNIVHRWGLHDTTPVQLTQLVSPSRVLCFAYKWKGEKKSTFVDPRNEDGIWDPEDIEYLMMIGTAHQLMAEADVIITYNGDRFDIPVLNAEFWLAGFFPPAPYRSVDHYKTYRKNFKLPSGKLAHLTTAIGLEGKVQHEGHALWTKCMAGDSKAWKTMRKYNLGDVDQLEELDGLLAAWVPNPPNVNLYDDLEDCCPQCGSDDYQSRGFRYTSTAMYRRFQCNQCARWFSSGKRVVGADLR